MTPLLQLAEHYYAVAHDLITQGERAIETGKYLGAMADRMCEQNIRETAPKPGPESTAETVAAGSASDPLTTPESIKGNAPDPLIAQPSAPVCSFCGMPDCEYFDGECVAGTVDVVQK